MIVSIIVQCNYISSIPWMKTFHNSYRITLADCVDAIGSSSLRRTGTKWLGSHHVCGFALKVLDHKIWARYSDRRDAAIATCIEEAWVVLVLGTTTNPLSLWL